MNKDKLLRRIKRILFFLAIFFGIAALIGLGLKFLELPGGGLLFVFSILFLAMIYYPGAVFFVWSSEFKQQKLLLSLAFGLAVSVLLAGILFKVQHWPSGAAMLNAGVILVVAFAVVFAILKRKSTPYLLDYYTAMVRHGAAMAIIGIAFYLIPASAFPTYPISDVEIEQTSLTDETN